MTNISDGTENRNPVAAAAKELISNGATLIELRGSDKRPKHKGWGSDINVCMRSPEDVPEDIESIGWPHKWNGTVAIDADDEKKWAAYSKTLGLDYMALAYGSDAVRITSGRTNRSKCLFKLPADMDRGELRWVNDQKNGGELRADTKTGSTTFEVLPPSIHPKTGKPYAWEGDHRAIPYLPREWIAAWIERLNAHKSQKFDGEDGDLIHSLARSALPAIDPNCEYDTWLSIGMALHAIDLGDEWEDWSEPGDSYEPGACYARLAGFTDTGGVTIATLFKHARDAGWDASSAWEQVVTDLEANPNADTIRKLEKAIRICHANPIQVEQATKKLSKALSVTKGAIKATLKTYAAANTAATDMTHAQIADTWRAAQPRMVYTDGELWYHSGTHWIERDRDMIKSDIARMFPDQKLCQRASDYNGIAGMAMAQVKEIDFFVNGQLGIACEDGAHLIVDDQIVIEPHDPEHRHQFYYDVTPVKGPTPLLDTLLSAITEDGRTLLQEFAGAMAFGIGTKYHRALLLYGESGAGKSTFIRLMELMCPGKSSSIAPHLFKDTQFAASLQGKNFNHYAELPKDGSIDSPELKMLLAGDAMTSKKVYQEPDKFRPVATHIYSANSFPNVDNDEDAFWRRWAIVNWTKKHSGNNIVDLAEQIWEKESAAVMDWVIEGARRVTRQAGYTLGEDHKLHIAMWKELHNPLLRCIADPDSPLEVGDNSLECGMGALSQVIRTYAREECGMSRVRLSDIRLLIRLHFEHRTVDHAVIIKGVRLKSNEDQGRGWDLH